MQHLYKTKQYFSDISPKQGTISTTIRSYKSICTKIINKTQPNYFARQPNYYDRIIRDEGELQRIRQYIINNPIKRSRDKENQEGIFI